MLNHSCMKKIRLLLIIVSLFIYSQINSQIYTSTIKAKFASKDDIDFVLVSDNNGGSSNCQY